MQNARDYTTKF